MSCNSLSPSTHFLKLPNQMSGKTEKYEVGLINDLKDGHENAFALLYDIFYSDLVLYCGTYIREKASCEDIVQGIFLKLWDCRTELRIETSLKSYLMTAVRNRCMDRFRHSVIVRNHAYNYLEDPLRDSYNTYDYVLYSDLRAKLDDALTAMEPKYSEAFRMNRFENLKYREIAEKLEVSEKTVENRIRKAAELLKKQLEAFRV